jgi:hypothetical protein
MEGIGFAVFLEEGNTFAHLETGTRVAEIDINTSKDVQVRNYSHVL